MRGVINLIIVLLLVASLVTMAVVSNPAFEQVVLFLVYNITYYTQNLNTTLSQLKIIGFFLPLLYCKVVFVVASKTILVTSYICTISPVNIAIKITVLDVFCFIIIRINSSPAAFFFGFLSKIFC
jgi:hypothetical protein